MVGDEVVTVDGGFVAEAAEHKQGDDLEEHFRLVGGVDGVEHGLLHLFGGVGQAQPEGDFGIHELVFQSYQAFYLDVAAAVVGGVNQS